jgi:hypothetical protein
MRENTQHLGLPKIGDQVVLGDTYYSLDGEKIVCHTVVTEWLVATREQLDSEMDRLESSLERVEIAMDMLARLSDEAEDVEDAKTDDLACDLSSCCHCGCDRGSPPASER